MSMKVHIDHLTSRLNSNENQIKEVQEAIKAHLASAEALTAKISELQDFKVSTQKAIELLKQADKEGPNNDSSKSEKTPRKRSGTKGQY